MSDTIKTDLVGCKVVLAKLPAGDPLAFISERNATVRAAYVVDGTPGFMVQLHGNTPYLDPHRDELVKIAAEMIVKVVV